jgi:hypothetical protein
MCLLNSRIALTNYHPQDIITWPYSRLTGDVTFTVPGFKETDSPLSPGDYRRIGRGNPKFYPRDGPLGNDACVLGMKSVGTEIRQTDSPPD